MKDLWLLLNLSILLLFTSCNRTFYYTPDDGTLLGISEKNDLKATGSLDFRLGTGYNLQMAYSPIKHLSLGGSFGKYHNAFKTVNQSIYSGFIGSYWRKEKYKVEYESKRFNAMRQAVVLDCYLGFSQGHRLSEFKYTNQLEKRLEFNFRRYYTQFGAHFTIDYLSLSYAIRGVFLDYTSFSSLGYISPEQAESLDNLEENDPAFHLENLVRIQLGVNNYRFFISTNVPIYLDEMSRSYMSPVLFQAGGIIEIGNLLLKRDKKEPIKDL